MSKVGASVRTDSGAAEQPAVAQRSSKPGGATLLEGGATAAGPSKPGGATLVQASMPAAEPASSTAAAQAGDAGAATTADTSTVTITYGPNADKATVPAACETVIKEIVAKAGDKSCTITSTARTPENQARVMYNNLESEGVEKQKELYGPVGDQVIDVYVASKAAKKTAEQIKADMLAKINELGPSKVSKHCADSSKLCVVDISPNSITHQTQFIAEVGKDSRVSKFLQPPDDPAYHLEIPV